jgi:ferredoxin/nitrate reductase gamma subunit
MAHEVDPKLLKKIRQYGAFDVNACFNCGNCTAVCPLAEDSSAFPRRAIRMAQLGMEDRLLAQENLWLCYACGECTKTCPRQADPAQFMASARRFAVARYDRTGISRLLHDSVFGSLTVFVLFSALFTLLLLWHKGDVNGQRLALFDFIPGVWIHDLGVALFVLVGVSALAGILGLTIRFAHARKAADKPLRFSLPALFDAARFALSDSLAHRRHRSCDAEAVQPPLYLRPWFVHATIFGGFLAMLAATTLDLLLKPIGAPVPAWYPIRLLGLLGGLVCLYGLSVAIIRRWQAREAPYDQSRFADWFFLGLLTATVVTGLIVELLVYLPQVTLFAYIIFLIHVVLAMDLIVLMPLSKFAHVLYRPLALALHHWSQQPVAQAATAAD